MATVDQMDSHDLGQDLPSKLQHHVVASRKLNRPHCIQARFRKQFSVRVCVAASSLERVIYVVARCFAEVAWAEDFAELAAALATDWDKVSKSAFNEDRRAFCEASAVA